MLTASFVLYSAYLSLIESQQAEPLHGAELGFKGLLGFLKNDMSTVLRLPSSEYAKLESHTSQRCFFAGLPMRRLLPFALMAEKGFPERCFL